MERALCHTCKERGLAYACFTNMEWSKLSDAQGGNAIARAAANPSPTPGRLRAIERSWRIKLGNLCSRFGWPLLAFFRSRF